MSLFAVAGVTGHVGSITATTLLAAGHRVRVLVRSADKGATWKDRGAEVAIGDLGDAAAVTAFLRGADGAFLLLPPNVTAPDFYAYQRATADAIAAGVSGSGVPHVVLLSSIAADLPDGNGPIKGLYYLEGKLRATSTKLTAVRAGYFAENVANMLGAPKGMGIWPNLSPPEYPVPMIATRDIAQHVVRFLVEPPAASTIIDLHGPASTAQQVADTISKVLGKPIQLVNIPPEGHLDALLQAGLPQQIAASYVEMQTCFREGKARPVGDRMLQGTTSLEDVLRASV